MISQFTSAIAWNKFLNFVSGASRPIWLSLRFWEHKSYLLCNGLVFFITGKWLGLYPLSTLNRLSPLLSGLVSRLAPRELARELPRELHWDADRARLKKNKKDILVRNWHNYAVYWMRTFECKRKKWKQSVECEWKGKTGTSDFLSNRIALTERFSNDCHFRKTKRK